MDMKVFDSLHYGKENAIPSKALAKALGFQSVGDLQIRMNCGALPGL